MPSKENLLKLLSNKDLKERFKTVNLYVNDYGDYGHLKDHELQSFNIYEENYSVNGFNDYVIMFKDLDNNIDLKINKNHISEVEIKNGEDTIYTIYNSINCDKKFIDYIEEIKGENLKSIELFLIDPETRDYFVLPSKIVIKSIVINFN